MYDAVTGRRMDVMRVLSAIGHITAATLAPEFAVCAQSTDAYQLQLCEALGASSNRELVGIAWSLLSPQPSPQKQHPGQYGRSRRRAARTDHTGRAEGDRR